MAGLQFTSILLPQPPRALELLMCIFMLGGPFSFFLLFLFFFLQKQLKSIYIMPLYTITYLRATVSFPSLQKVRFILWKRQNTRSLGRRTQITVKGVCVVKAKPQPL